MRAEFAKRLVSRMKNRGWTPKDVERRSAELVLAQRVKRGINRANVYPYMEGRGLPNKDSLATLAAVFECDPNDLVPNADSVQVSRGRRRVRETRAYVACKRASAGLDRLRLQVDVILPSDAALGLYTTLRQGFRARGYELEPDGPGDVSRTLQ